MPVTKTLPNRVMQTTRTNCFQACVATILELPISDVPMACDESHWSWSKFQEWLSKRKLQAIEITFQNGGSIYPVAMPVLCVVSGPSPRVKDRLHAVVGRYVGSEGFELLHDPHPDQLWINGEPTHATFFVPCDPRILMEEQNGKKADKQRRGRRS